VRTLWLTNDLPPRPGGIQQFVANLARRVAPSTTVVIGPRQEGSAAFDDGEPYRVVRSPSSRVLPTARALRLVVETARAHRPDVVVLGASWPLGELAPAITRRTGAPVVAITHGLEAGFATAGLGRLIRHATQGCAAATVITRFTEERLTPFLPPRVERVPPGVDIEVFHPTVDGSASRERWGVPAGAPLVGCVSRLVDRKGQDVLLAAWPRIRREHPDVWLVLVGDGPLAPKLRATVDQLGPASQVVLAGGVAWSELPAAYAALDLHAFPCRTRLRGLDVEGLGMVSLEAQATGVPVVVGRSGGAPEAVVEGVTGLVVDGTSPADVARAVGELIGDPARRTVMGPAARGWVESAWSWTTIADRFRELLVEVAS